MDRILFIIVGGTLGYLYSIIRDLQKRSLYCGNKSRKAIDSRSDNDFAPGTTPRPLMVDQ